LWVFSILSPDFTVVGVFRVQILSHFLLKPYVCRCRYYDGTVLPAPASTPASMEGGESKKREGRNEAIIGNGGGRYYTVRVGRASVPPRQQRRQDLGAHWYPSNVVMMDRGAGGKEGALELWLAIFIQWEDACQFVDCGNGNGSSGRVAMDYFAFDAIKDAKGYLTGEGRAGADNNNGPGTAVDAPSRTKDTEVGQKTEREGKGGMRKEEPRTADAVAMPAAIAKTLLLRLRKKTNGGWGSSSLPMAPLWPRQQQHDHLTTTDVMFGAVVERSNLPRAMFVFYLHMGIGEIHWWWEE
jgi:hypothetical protein